MRVCAACSYTCPLSDFSQRQYTKGVGVSRCSSCVADGRDAILDPRQMSRIRTNQFVNPSRIASDVEVFRRIQAARQHNFDAPLLQLTQELKLAVLCASLSREPLEIRWGCSKESVLQPQRLSSRDLGRFEQISTDMWFDRRARATVETAAQVLVEARLDGHTSRAKRRGEERWLHVLHRLEQGLRFTAVNTQLITPLAASSAPALRCPQRWEPREELERPPGAKQRGRPMYMRQECGGAVLHSRPPTEFVRTTAVCATDPMIEGIHRVLFTRHWPSYGDCNIGVVRCGWNPTRGGWASATRQRSKRRWAWIASLDDENHCSAFGHNADAIEMELDLSRGTLSAMPQHGDAWRVIAAGLRGPLCWMVELENGGDLVSIVSSPLVLSEKAKEEHSLQHAPTGRLKSRNHYDRRVREKLANRAGWRIDRNILDELAKAAQEQSRDAQNVARFHRLRVVLGWRCPKRRTFAERVPDVSWGELAANTEVRLRASSRWACNSWNGARSVWRYGSILEDGEEVIGTIIATDMTGDDQTSQLEGSEVRLAVSKMLNVRLGSAASVSRWAASDLLEMVADWLYVGKPAYLVYSDHSSCNSWGHGEFYNNAVWQIPCAELHDRLIPRDKSKDTDVERPRAPSSYCRQELSRQHGAYNRRASSFGLEYTSLSSSSSDDE
jgi:hypothetical protein